MERRGEWALTRATLRAVAREGRAWARRALDTPLDYLPRSPDAVVLSPPDILPGDSEAARALYGGRYALAGHTIETDGGSPFDVADAPREWLRALHGFGWLRHSRALGTALSRSHARSMTEDWIERHGGGPLRGRRAGVAWEPIVSASRLRHWLSHAHALLGGEDEAFLATFLRQIALHERHVRRAARDTHDPLMRLRLVAVLLLTSFALGGGSRDQRRLTAWLEDELARQILPDGGHVSRRAEALVELAVELMPLLQCYVGQGRVAPRELLKAIDRMGPALRMHIHADETLAMLNGTNCVRMDRLRALLELDPAGGARPVVSVPANAPDSGYQRLAIGGTVVLADTGTVPAFEHASRASVAPLAFELSTDVGTGGGARRLIVSLGSSPEGGEELSRALRFAAAHSTLTVDRRDLGRINVEGMGARLTGETMVGGPDAVDVRRADAEDGSWRGFRATHDGYAREPGGPLHERILTLTNGGRELRGQDGLKPRAGDGADRFAAPAATIRFHLHPDVAAAERADGVHLSWATGAGWTFSVDGEGAPVPRIEESLYCGGRGPRPTRQIVLHLPEGRGTVAWTLRANDA